MLYAVKDKATGEVFRNNSFLDVLSLINMRTPMKASDLVFELTEKKEFKNKHWTVIEEESK